MARYSDTLNGSARAIQRARRSIQVFHQISLQIRRIPSLVREGRVQISNTTANPTTTTISPLIISTVPAFCARPPSSRTAEAKPHGRLCHPLRPVVESQSSREIPVTVFCLFVCAISRYLGVHKSDGQNVDTSDGPNFRWHAQGRGSTLRTADSEKGYASESREKGPTDRRGKAGVCTRKR